ncbi:hypothetical protein DUI87_17994 [Hirundo rustica rustica]|uniref:Uncharacterized protein n=1 Tax=Hirundo rustica rustica TaxID=333673 RepID=A0A3M0JXC0_HIRRU|nr:hypothetical protein DUI87_17994 [Hirundo rustica rustica]
MQFRTCAAFWAANAYFQIMSSSSLTNTPKFFSSGLLSNRSSPSLYSVFGIAPIQGQDLALGLAELHEVCVRSPFKPVQSPLDGIPSLQSVTHTTQPGVISKLDGGALNSTDIRISNRLA